MGLQDHESSAPYAPEVPKRPTHFSDLPPELRLLIYAYVFEGFEPATLRLYKLPLGPQWLVRYHDGIVSPPILRVCKAIYFEARDELYKQLGSPIISIRHHWDIYVSCVPDPGKGAWKRDGMPDGRAPYMRTLYYALPLLMGVRDLRLEIVLSRWGYADGSMAYAKGVRLLALLRWMSAVFAVREAPLNRVMVVVKFEGRRDKGFECGSEVCLVVMGLRGRSLEVERRGPEGCDDDAFVVGRDEQAQEVGVGGWEDVEDTWAVLLDTGMGLPKPPRDRWKYVRLLWAGKWMELWEAFGDWLRGEME